MALCTITGVICWPNGQEMVNRKFRAKAVSAGVVSQDGVAVVTPVVEFVSDSFGNVSFSLYSGEYVIETDGVPHVWIRVPTADATDIASIMPARIGRANRDEIAIKQGDTFEWGALIADPYGVPQDLTGQTVTSGFLDAAGVYHDLTVSLDSDLTTGRLSLSGATGSWALGTGAFDIRRVDGANDVRTPTVFVRVIKGITA